MQTGRCVGFLHAGGACCKVSPRTNAEPGPRQQSGGASTVQARRRAAVTWTRTLWREASREDLGLFGPGAVNPGHLTGNMPEE